MKFIAIVLLALTGANSKVCAQTTASVTRPEWCGPSGGNVTVAGSSTVLPIAEAWATGYMKACPGINVTVESGGSSAGAGKVCNDTERGAPVDIGTMSRAWKDTEANITNGYTYACLIGDTKRSAIQVDVSTD